MSAPPKPNEIPVYLSRVDPKTKSPEFVFDHDRNTEIPPEVPIYMNIAIGTVKSLADSVLYSEEGDDRGNGYYLYDAERKPIDWVEKVKNSFHIKQSELAIQSELAGGKKKKVKKTKKAKKMKKTKSKKTKKTGRKSIRRRRR